MTNAAPGEDDVVAEAAATTPVAPTTARIIASRMVSNKAAKVARSAGGGVADVAAVTAVAETTALRSR